MDVPCWLANKRSINKDEYTQGINLHPLTLHFLFATDAPTAVLLLPICI